MHCKGIEFPAYLPNTDPGYPWAIAGGHMSMEAHLLLAREGDTSLEYWVKAITQRELYQVCDDMLGLCKFSAANPRSAAQILRHETGLEIAEEGLLAAVSRAYIRGLWLERKQGFERSEYTLPPEIFDRPNYKLCIGPFLTREFFSALSERIWAVSDREIAAL